MPRKNFINKPFGFRETEETRALEKAVARFNRRVQPFPAEKPVSLREIARDLITRRAERKPVKRGRYAD
jgi:hypothetical protein